MNPVTPQYVHQVQSFAAWVEKNQRNGVDGWGDQACYVPCDKLKDYWDHDRIASIVGRYGKDVDIDKLRNCFLQEFSILVYISGPRNRWSDYISYFCRRQFQLPLPKPPDVELSHSDHSYLPFPDSPDGKAAYTAFFQHQWTFIPLRFVDDSHHRIGMSHDQAALDPSHILPVDILEQFREPNGSVEISKIVPHKSSGLPETPIVMKQYSRTEAELEFKQERQTYMSINNSLVDRLSINKHFLRYYGSFAQGDKYAILVESADEGTLTDLFRKCWYLPRHDQEALDLWDDLGQLCTGIRILHEKRAGRTDVAIHQGLNPSNIYAFRDPDKPGRILFKLGGFGLSSVSRQSEDDDAVGGDNHGSKMYSAPETSRQKEDLHGLRGHITPAVDVWSLGCVFFEAAVWMATFDRGRDEFCQARIDATSNLKSLISAEYRGAFHDGNEALRLLSDKAREISNLGTPVACLSRNVMDFVLDEMLLPGTGTRLRAEQLHERFRRVLHPPRAQPPTAPSRNPTTTTLDLNARTMSLKSPTDPPLHGDGVSPPELRRNSISIFPYSQQPGELEKQTEDSHNQLRPCSREGIKDPWGQSFSSITTCYEEVPVSRQSTNKSKSKAGHHYSSYNPCSVGQVIEWIPKSKRHNEKLDQMDIALKDLVNRDQVFIIDNSASMEPHWEDVKKTTRALSYIARNIDPDGFEIHMTNTSGHTKQMKDDKLFGERGFLEAHRPQNKHGRCRMEKRLSDILPRVIKKAAKRSNMRKLWSHKVEGINVYVLTDGVWEPAAKSGLRNEAAKVEHSIENAVACLKSLNLPRVFLSIQFIRFGNDKTGERRMRWLDDDIEAKTGHWDIVDTTHHTGSVWKMIIGATSAFEDNAEDRPFLVDEPPENITLRPKPRREQKIRSESRRATIRSDLRPNEW